MKQSKLAKKADKSHGEGKIKPIIVRHLKG
jgi:hypothetical protein